MKVSMSYGTNTYGNTSNAPQYRVKLSRSKAGGPLSITFDFERPAAGRGLGWSQGAVVQVSLSLNAEPAQALSHALQLALSNTASSEVMFQIDELASHS